MTDFANQVLEDAGTGASSGVTASAVVTAPEYAVATVVTAGGSVASAVSVIQTVGPAAAAAYLEFAANNPETAVLVTQVSAGASQAQNPGTGTPTTVPGWIGYLSFKAVDFIAKKF
jgi:hypothetical protein